MGAHVLLEDMSYGKKYPSDDMSYRRMYFRRTYLTG